MQRVELLAPDEALSRSAIRPRFPVLAVVVLIGAMMAVGLVLTPAAEGPAQAVQRTIALLVPLGALAYAMFWSAHLAAELRRETREVRLAGEAEAMGRPADSEVLCQKLLSSSMLSPVNRIEALWVYVALLLRRDRFGDIPVLVERLLAEGVPLQFVALMRGARAYALLREDRLVDADRALTDLRRDDVAEDGVSEAVYRLLSMFRDVANGHPEEALATYEAHRYKVLQRLGTRAAAADALAAAAAHGLGRGDEARRYWQRATALESPAELVQRYPVVGPVAQAYGATVVPAEVAEVFASVPAMSGVAGGVA